jgi:hypothetical protein
MGQRGLLEVIEVRNPHFGSLGTHPAPQREPFRTPGLRPLSCRNVSRYVSAPAAWTPAAHRAEGGATEPPARPPTPGPARPLTPGPSHEAPAAAGYGSPATHGVKASPPAISTRIRQRDPRHPPDRCRTSRLDPRSPPGRKPGDKRQRPSPFP